MPRLVDELTPLQSMWLYENQSLTRVSDDEPIDLWTAISRTNSDNGIFRDRNGQPTITIEPTVQVEESRKRKREYFDDYSSQQWDFPFHRCRPVDSTDESISRWPTAGPTRSSHDQHDWGRRPDFPHSGDKLTWEQSYENLQAYKDVFGVRSFVLLETSSLSLHSCSQNGIFRLLMLHHHIPQDCNVPQKYKDNRKLGGWVNKQRKKKKNPEKYGRLSTEQIDRLTLLGFKWQ